MRFENPKNIFPLLLFFVLFFFCSCTTTDEYESKKVFRYNEASGITSLDPAFARSQANIWAVSQLYNGLVQMDESMNIIPCLAHSWKISEDGLNYTFYLNTNVAYHSSALIDEKRRVIASDFVFSFNRIMDEKTASPGAWVFNAIARDVNDVPEIKAENDSVLTIRLKYSFPPFLSILTSAYCSVVPPEIVQHFGKDFRSNPIGTGPFKLFLWQERGSMVFHKNEHYFEFDKEIRLPYLDAVQISFIPDRQAAFLEFVKGKLDFLSGLDASYKDDLLSRNGELKKKYKGKFNFETGPYLNTEYLAFSLSADSLNQSKSILSDVRIRKAINYGFDRVSMIKYLRNSIGSPGSCGITPRGLPSFSDSILGYDYQPQLSAQLLSEAGFVNGKGLPEIVLSTTPEYLDLCEFIQSQLKDIGIRIKLEVNQGAQHREMVAQNKLAFYRASWIADYPDAENYFSLFYSANHSPKGPNTTHFLNQTFDQLYHKALQLNNDSLRYMNYQSMEKILIEECPFVILYYDQVLRLSQKSIHGIQSNAMNGLSLKKVRKD
ncbi:MAG TPA: ABC transporter substrate-binding protein [Bacteroidia bacterium]|nr:ABC transporter substrate-binding protein [Bacteroidia bacterium]HNT79940.1 ABC transporter substrate-binding protein [Bacteroidia bacterium]